MTRDVKKILIAQVEVASDRGLKQQPHEDEIGLDAHSLWTSVSTPAARSRRCVAAEALRRHRRRIIASAVLASSGAGIMLLRPVLVGEVEPRRDAAPAISGATTNENLSTQTTATTSQNVTPTKALVVSLAQTFELPRGMEKKCRVAPALDADADIAAVCELGRGAMRVELRQIESSTLRQERMTQLAGTRGPTQGESKCALGRPEVRTWAREATPRLVAGTFGCQVVDGRAEFVWTDDSLSLLGRAIRIDADLAKLFAWWSTNAPGSGIA